MSDPMLLFTSVLGFHLTIGVWMFALTRERLALVLGLLALPLWVWAFTLFH